MKRTALYCFYDEKGIVRDFVIYYLKALQDICNEVFVICNCELESKSREKLNSYGFIVIERENVGFDVYAWRYAIEQIGWENLKEIDELILCNYTCYGPVYPFSEMFDIMNNRHCDFWGAVKHPEQPAYLLPNGEGYIYEHIMSYFIVVRNGMLSSEDFKDYWQYMPEINTKSEAVGYNETKFTKHFEDLGYISDSYVDLADYKGRCYNSSIILANELLIKSRCPLVKRRAFFFPDYDGLIQSSDSRQANELIRFIDKKTDYDAGLIWNDLLETQKMSTLINNMQLSWIVSGMKRHKLKQNVLLAVYIPQIEYMNILIQYLPSLLSDRIKITLFCNSREIEEYCSSVVTNSNVKIRFFETNNNMQNSLMTAVMRESDGIQYTCCVLDYASQKRNLAIEEEDWLNYLYSSMFLNEGFVSEIVEIFEQNKFLGALFPTESDFGSYYARYYCKLNNNIGYLQKKHCELGLSTKFDDGIYSNGEAVFWIRTNLYKKINKKMHTKYEGINCDAFLQWYWVALIQAEGKYVGTVSELNYAKINIANQHFYKHNFLKKMRMNGGNGWSYYAQMKAIDHKNTRTVYIDKDRKSILDTQFALKEIFEIIKKYPSNHKKYINEKKKREVFPVFTYLKNVMLEENFVCLYFMSGRNMEKTGYVILNGKKYYVKKELNKSQSEVKDYVKAYSSAYVMFFYLPVSEIRNATVALYDGNGEKIYFKWSNGISFNAIELNNLSLHVFISDGELHFYDLNKITSFVKKSKEYTFGDKLRFFFIKMNKIHNVVLMSENLGGADNTYQVFKKAIDNGERHTYFIVSRQYFDSKKNDKYKKKMLIYNSKKHLFLMHFAKLWIGSYSLRTELLPTTEKFKDVHLNLMRCKWIFIPHGMAVGDKQVSMLHVYAWDNPSKTFANAMRERDSLAHIYGFKNVTCLGAPRMDKWNTDSLNDNQILVFFTWRMGFSKGRNQKVEDFKASAYYITINEMMHKIAEEYPKREIVYVFHHEIVKTGCDKEIRDVLSDLKIKYIYLNDNKNAQMFDLCFRTAKYLITDFSSVAYDFAYKKESVVIYYLEKNFIDFHYGLKEDFFDVQLGEIASSMEEVVSILRLNTPSKTAQERRSKFFYSNDFSNAERVYNAIFKKSTNVKYINELQIERKKYDPQKVLNIYFFFDKDGIVDDYVLYYLSEMKKNHQEICFVANGKIKPKCYKKVKKIADKIIVRDNIGFDAGAYREAIESYGYDKIGEYDELILDNFTIFGPVYSVEKMFSKMNEVDCDFWGISRYLAMDGQKFDNVDMVDHLQSYFLVFRKRILKSETFKKYWKTMILPSNYMEAVKFHELRCTQYFEKLGYCAGEFIPNNVYGKKAANIAMYRAYSNLVTYQCPFIKRKIFSVKNKKFEFPLHEKNSIYDLCDYLRNNTIYDTELIWKNINRTYDYGESTSMEDKRKIEEQLQSIRKKEDMEVKANILKNQIVDVGRMQIILDKEFVVN